MMSRLGTFFFFLFLDEKKRFHVKPHCNQSYVYPTHASMWDISPTAAHTINILTHLPCLLFVTYADRGVSGIGWPAAAFFFSCTASCFMHLSETKHNLPGLLNTGRYSSLLLGIDRFAAVTLALVVAAHAETWRHYRYTLIFAFATILTIAGEITTHRALYVTLHGVWHIAVFTMATFIILSKNPLDAQVGKWIWQDAQRFNALLFYVGLVLGLLLLVAIGVFLHPPFMTPVLEVLMPGVTWRIPSNGSEEKILHLTIDDGPTMDTHRVLDVIEQHEVSASFFTPTENLLNASLGNARHRLLSLGTIENHMNLQEAPALKMSLGEFGESVLVAQRGIDAFIASENGNAQPLKDTTIGSRPRQWLRPASGLVSQAQITQAISENYRVVIGSVHPMEAKPAFFWKRAWPLATLHLKLWFILLEWGFTIEEYGRPIVILHDRPWTPSVLHVMIPWWKARGWSVRALPPAQAASVDE